MSARATCECCGRVRDIMSLDCIASPLHEDSTYGILVCEDRHGCMNLHRPIGGPFSYKERRLKAKASAAGSDKP